MLLFIFNFWWTPGSERLRACELAMRQGAATLKETTCTGVVQPLQALQIREQQSGMSCAGHLLQVLGQVVLVDWQHFWPQRESAVVAGKHGTLHPASQSGTALEQQRCNAESSSKQLTSTAICTYITQSQGWSRARSVR